MQDWKLSELRKVLTGFAPRKKLSNETWESWKRLAGVEPYQRKCSQEVALRLCVVCKYRRLGVVVSSLKVKLEARRVQHPSQVIPGLTFERSFDSLPSMAQGDELSSIFLARWDHEPSERSLRRYAESAGLDWKLSRIFTRSEIAAIEQQYIKRRQSEVRSGLHLAQSRKPKLQVA